jgi:glutamyl-tRNA reductase
MGLFICGINHKRADLALREQCAVSEDVLPHMLSTLMSLPAIEEAMVLSTCNRTELIGVSDPSWPALNWMADYFQIDANTLPGYHYQDDSAITHLMEVASGLDSMVLGENHILGQIKRAYDAAQMHQTAGNTLNQLMPTVFSVGKAVRHNTDINENVSTMPSAIKQMIRDIPSISEQPRILYIGASEMNTDIAQALSVQDYPPTYWVNRTFEKAQAIAEKTHAQAIDWHALQSFLPEVDVIISATSSPEPILQASSLPSLQTRTKPLLLIDLAVPRDIANDVDDYPHVHLYNLDDLQTRINSGKATRLKAVDDAQTIIQEQLDRYAAQQLHQQHSTLISNYRAQAERLREEALQDAINNIAKGMSAEQACEQLSKQLTARLLHHPTLGLRDMIERSDGPTLACLAARLENKT